DLVPKSWRVPVARPNDFEIIVKARGNGNNAHHDEAKVVLGDWGVENQKFPKESRGKRDTGERGHGNEHGESKEGGPLGKPGEIFELIASVLSNEDKHGKAQQRHQQISDEVECNR